MKEWWHQLALREKQMLAAGSLIVSLLLIYLLLWSPLDNKVMSLRHQIRQNQELLAWMKETNKRIASLEKKSHPTVSLAKGSLLNVIQKEINKSPLAKNVTQLHQAENDSVQLAFQSVNFDQLMTWLIQLNQQQNITVTQISVTPGAKPGMVSADMVLK